MNTTTAHPAPEEILAFFDHELAPQLAASVSAHIDECPDCSAALANFTSTSQTLANWHVPPISPILSERILRNEDQLRSAARIKKPRLFVRISFWSWKQWTAGLGAVAATLLFIAVFFIPNSYRHNRAESFVEATKGVTVDSATVRRLTPGEEPMTRQPLQAQLAQQQLSSQLESNASDLQSEEKDSETLPNPPQAPMISRSAALTIITKDFPASRASLDAILSRHHAYAAELKASTAENEPRSLTASIRVPARDLGSTLAELKTLGRVQEETQNGEEVTQQHMDLTARLKNARETEQRLVSILAQRTGKISDVLEVEREVSRVRGEIESMEAELKALDHRVDFASINLTLNEEYQASISIPPLSAGMRLRNAIVGGFRNAGETILGILLFFAEYGLTLAIWLAILGIPVYLLRRRYRRSLASV